MADTIDVSEVIREHYAPDVKNRRTDSEYVKAIESSGTSKEQFDVLKNEVLSSMDKLRHFGVPIPLEQASMHSVDDSHGDDTRVYQSDYRGVPVEVHYGDDGSFDCSSLFGGDDDGVNVTQIVSSLIESGDIVSDEPSLDGCSLYGVMTIDDDDWSIIHLDFGDIEEAVAKTLKDNDRVYVHRLTYIPYTVIGKDGVVSAYQGDGHAPLHRTYEDVVTAQGGSVVPFEGVVIRFFSDLSLKGETKSLEIRYSDTILDTYARDIRWVPSGTGRLTAHVIVDPVGPAGLTDIVFRSLSDFLEAGIHYGDALRVTVHNDGIRLHSNEGGGNVELPYPQYWNGSKTVVIGSMLFGSDPSSWKKTMYSQASLLAGDGISKSFVDKMYSQYGAMTLTDMYYMVNSDGFRLKGFGQKKVDKVRECFDEVSKADLLTFIVALALDGIGEATASKILGKVAVDAEDRNVSQYTVLLHMSDPLGYVGVIKDVSEKVAVTFAASYGFIVDQLNDFSVAFGHYPKEFEGSVDNGGPQIVVSGSFDGMHRHDVRDILIKNGYNLMTRVTSDTALLVVGVDGGRKEEAARSLGVDVFETGGDFKKGAAEIEKRFKNA